MRRKKATEFQEYIKIYVGGGNVNTLMAYMSLSSDSSTRTAPIFSFGWWYNRETAHQPWKEPYLYVVSRMTSSASSSLIPELFFSPIFRRLISSSTEEKQARKGTPSKFVALFAHDTTFSSSCSVRWHLNYCCLLRNSLCLSVQVTLILHSLTPSIFIKKKRTKCQQIRSVCAGAVRL